MKRKVNNKLNSNSKFVKNSFHGDVKITNIDMDVKHKIDSHICSNLNNNNMETYKQHVNGNIIAQHKYNSNINTNNQEIDINKNTVNDNNYIDCWAEDHNPAYFDNHNDKECNNTYDLQVTQDIDEGISILDNLIEELTDIVKEGTDLLEVIIDDSNKSLDAPLQLSDNDYKKLLFEEKTAIKMLPASPNSILLTSFKSPVPINAPLITIPDDLILLEDFHDDLFYLPLYSHMVDTWQDLFHVV